MSGQLVWICLAVCGVVFGLGLGRGYPLLEMLKTAIALAVAAVPEGLPAVATTTLALGIRAMAKHQVLIRRLAAVETLGSLQTLCFDKTGTLTTNQMAVVPLDSQQRQTITESNQAMAARGLRVLGVAAGQGPETTAIPLVRLGLVGLADPLRPGVEPVIAQFHQAGIATVMITGDQSATAYAIGESLNLSQGAPLRLVDGGQLEEEEWAAPGDRVDIFSRISPAQKLKVVQALQRAGQVVGMTGDGINDAPDLRAAQVGIAMGQSGSAAAREVADVVLQDDNLATMVTAISQGRTIYRNIRQSVHFLLATNLSEIMVMLLGVSLGLGAPLSALQLLWLNLVTDIFPGLALALEPTTPDLLRSPPRDPAESIIPPVRFWRITLEAAVLATSALAAYGYGLHRYGQGPQATTIGFMGLTLAQVLHALSCRSPGPALLSPTPLPPNPYLGLGLSLALILQLCSALVPGLHQRLQVAPLNGVDAAVIGVAALLPLLLNELSKAPWRLWSRLPTPPGSGSTIARAAPEPDSP